MNAREITKTAKLHDTLTLALRDSSGCNVPYRIRKAIEEEAEKGKFGISFYCGGNEYEVMLCRLVGWLESNGFLAELKRPYLRVWW